MKQIFIVAISLMQVCFLNAQMVSSCSVSYPVNTEDLINSWTTPIDNNENFCIKVEYHLVKQTGSIKDTVDINDVIEVHDILNQDFNGHNISFEWDGTLEDAAAEYMDSKPDQIDIYILEVKVPEQPDDLEIDWGGSAEGVGTHSRCKIKANYFPDSEIYLMKTSAVSHEVGHVLGLYHTHHGTKCEINTNDASCPETSGNGAECGDYVADTPPDPGMKWEVDDANCEWKPTNTALLALYDPDVTNIMSSSHPLCWSGFSGGQVERMKKALNVIPAVKQVRIEAITSKIDIRYGGTFFDMNGVLWSRYWAEYQGENAADYTWEWGVTSGYIKYGPNKRYIDFRSSEINSYTANIELRAFKCVWTGWISETFNTPTGQVCIPGPCNTLIPH